MRVRLLALAALTVILSAVAVPAAAFEFAEMTMTSCEASADAADPVAALPLGAKPGPTPDATCTAVCHNGTTRTCTGSTCSAVNASCPSQAGYVRCDGVTTSCPACPPPPSCPPSSMGPCTATKQCAFMCGSPGVCTNGCCYCY